MDSKLRLAFAAASLISLGHTTPVAVAPEPCTDEESPASTQTYVASAALHGLGAEGIEYCSYLLNVPGTTTYFTTATPVQ